MIGKAILLYDVIEALKRKILMLQPSTSNIKYTIYDTIKDCKFMLFPVITSVL